MKTVKILLVDDSEVMLRHVATLLGQKGLHALLAQNLQTALEVFHRQKPDALLIDFILQAGTTGLGVVSAISAVVERLNATGESLALPPTAVLTRGALTDEDQQKANSLGVRVIQKPSQGKEKEFLQEVEFWLHDAKLIGNSENL
ncbi:MAG: response regulator [Bdellovibrionota bacterium]